MESHSKVCSRCKEEKPLEAFGKDRSKKDGLHNQCKGCRKQCHQENREKKSEYGKQYYQDNREKISEYAKQHRQENREYYSEYAKQYHKKNRKKRAEHRKQHYQDNVEKYTVYSTKRRALKRDAVPDALLNCPIEKDRLDKTYKLRSLLSKATGVEYHVDHIWPLSKGGPHWSGNLQVITAKENLSKSDSFCEDTARVIQESLDEHLSNRQ